MISSMQPPNNPGAQYPTWRYHWTKDPLVVHNAGEESALGGGWGDTPGSFAAYRGPRPARTDRQNATQWVDDWPVHGGTPEHRRAIQIELLRADAEFWRSPDTPGAHLATMRQAFDGIAMCAFGGRHSDGVPLTPANPAAGVGRGDRRGVVARGFRDAPGHLPRTVGPLLGVARRADRLAAAGPPGMCGLFRPLL